MSDFVTLLDDKDLLNFLLCFCCGHTMVCKKALWDGAGIFMDVVPQMLGVGLRTNLISELTESFPEIIPLELIL